MKRLNLEAAAILTQNNPVIFFQLGLLKYNQQDNDGARDAFGRAVQLSNDYANALYFLGLTEDRLGNTESAIQLFERVSGLNPENTEVKGILENLNDGLSPFAGGGAPAVPEELPIDEDSQNDPSDAEILEADPEASDLVETAAEELTEEVEEPSEEI